MSRRIMLALEFVAVVALCAVAISGCHSLEPGGQGEEGGESQAIVLVVEDVYSQLGQSSSFYVGGDAADDAIIGQAKVVLESDLQTKVLFSSERISGEPGGSVALGRFRIGDDGRARVVASFVNEPCTHRGCVEYVLEREGEQWSIADATDVWPDCLIAAQGKESYHSVLARVRSNGCLGLWSIVGTCGELLYVGEGLGYGGTHYYFDPLTGLSVAEELCTDVDEGFGLCYFSFGHVDCDPVTTGTIICDR